MMHRLLHTPAGATAAICLIGLLALLGYFLPFLTAMALGHPHSRGVFLLDLLAGWTVIGWLAAMVWALWQGNGGGTFDGGETTVPRAGRFWR